MKSTTLILFVVCLSLFVSIASRADAQCGNGTVGAPEACDDGNTLAGDGCGAACAVESGFVCRSQTPIALINASFELPISAISIGWVLAAGTIDQFSSACSPADHGLLAVDMNGSSRGEIYQDVPTAPGTSYTMTLRGSANCIETGAEPCSRTCSKLLTISAADATTPTAPHTTTSYDLPGGSGTPTGAWRDVRFQFTATSSTTRIRFSGSDPSFAGPMIDRAAIPESICRLDTCGSGTVDAMESCDDGNQQAGDGCSSDCAIIESGWACAAAGAACTPTCGDGLKVSVEACDDGDTTGGDGCSATCTIEPGWTCIVNALEARSECRMLCGDGSIDPGEACDDGDSASGDGCSSTCAREPGWGCSCATPTFTYSAEMLAGRLGGDGGGPGPQMGCTGNDVLIGLALDWSGNGTATRTRAICGAVSVSAAGVVTTTRTTSAESGGSGCAGWDPSVYSPDVICPSGTAIVGLRGTATGATLFTSASIVCQAMGVDGRPAGTETTLPVPGGGGTGGAQLVDCPAGTIARFFQTRAGCGQDALDLFCGVPTAVCTSSSICSTQCGDGAVGAPIETCDTAGESATCDADCTMASCGDGTVNAAASEMCDASGESATCDADCTMVSCGDTTVNATAGELCDAGGESATCDADCTPAACGDTQINAMAGESCDDGGESAACDADCTMASCGDGTANAAASETCDTAGESATCDGDCTASVCGDGRQNTIAGESCDDGNVTGGDGCGATCVSEACGNGIVDGTESCDDGGESATCDADCTPAECGDGAANAAAGESCDGAGASATCDVDCTPAECGDGTLNTAAGETCDDGDTTSGDGCSASCSIETPPIDAGAGDAGAGDAGVGDAGAGDAGAGDAGRRPGGLAGGGGGCALVAPQRVPALGWAAALAFLVLGAGRRRRRARARDGAA